MTSCEHPLKPGVDVLRTYLEKQVLVVFRWGKEEHRVQKQGLPFTLCCYLWYGSY